VKIDRLRAFANHLQIAGLARQ